MKMSHQATIKTFLVPSDIVSFMPIILRALRKIVRPNELDDAAQTVLLRLLENFTALRNAENPKAWVYGVAKRVGWEISRGKQRREKSTEAKDASGKTLGDKLPDCSDPTEEKVAGKEEIGMVLAAIETLPLEEQFVLHMTHVDGMTGDEIAKLLNIKPSTVRQRVMRARNGLKMKVARVAKFGTQEPLQRSTVDRWRTLLG